MDNNRMNDIKDLTDKIVSGDYVHSNDDFYSIMQDKIDERLGDVVPDLFQEAVEKKVSNVEVRFDRHVRAHGKNPNVSADAFWAFTHKDKGHVNHKNEKEIYHVNGTFNDAKKTAVDWAKKHGHEKIYVMESSEELEELSRETSLSYAVKAGKNQDSNIDKYNKGDRNKKILRDILNRSKGIDRAISKFTGK